MASAICGSTDARVCVCVFRLETKRFCGHNLVFYKVQKRWESPLEGVAAAFVGFASKAYRVGHVRRARLELAQEIGLLRSLRKEQFDQALVIARHHEDMRGFSGRAPPRQAGCGSLPDQRRQQKAPESHAGWRACRARRLRPPIGRGCHRVPARSFLKSPSAIGLRQTLPVQTKRTCFIFVNEFLKMGASGGQVNRASRKSRAFVRFGRSAEDRLHKTLVKRF